MIYRPENVLILGWVCYLFIYTISPLEIRVPFEFGGVAFIAATCATFILGSRFADGLRFVGRRPRISARRHGRIEGRLFWAALGLGFVGNLLRLLDKYVARGVGANTGLDAREVLIEQGASLLSSFGGLLYPFGFLPIFILLGARSIPKTSWKLVLAVAVFLIPALDALVFLSRSVLFVSLAMVFFGASLTLFQGRLLSRKLFMPALIGSGAMLSISTVVFFTRLDAMSFSIMNSVFISGYAYTVTPSAGAMEVATDGSVFGGVVLSLLPISQYYVHGLLEFQLLWSFNENQTHSYGALLFAPYVKLISLMGFGSEPDLVQLFPRVGVFTSFWGPLWVDFGWFSLLVMFALGFISRRIGLAAQALDLGAIPLYTYFCVILFFMPVVNFAVSAQGMYIVNAFVIFWLITRGMARAVVT